MQNNSDHLSGGAGGGVQGDGGTAFPVPGLQHEEAFNGMSLRDYFAAKALSGAVSDEGMACITIESVKKRHPLLSNDLALATGCYEMADAMLKARSA